SKWPVPALIARANWLISSVVPPPLIEAVCAAAAVGNASPAATNNTATTMRRSLIAPPPFRLLPLVRHLEDLDKCLVNWAPYKTLNPQNDVPRVKGSLGKGRYWGRRPPARAGEADTAPPSRPSGAPSAAITPTRLMATTPSAPPHGGPAPGISSSRRTRRSAHSRHCLHHHPFAPPPITLCSFWGQFESCLCDALPCGSGPCEDRGRCSLTAWRSCWAPTCARVIGPTRSCGE